MRHLIAFAIAAAFAAPAPEARAYQIEVTDYSDIRLAVAISDAVDSTKEAVDACVRDGGERTPCLCAAEYQIDELRAAIDEALAAHPEWRRRTLYIDDKGDGSLESLTLHLGRAAAYAASPRGCY